MPIYLVSHTMSVGVIRPCHHTNYDKVQNQAGLEAVWARLAAPERLQRGELQAISAETTKLVRNVLSVR